MQRTGRRCVDRSSAEDAVALIIRIVGGRRCDHPVAEAEVPSGAKRRYVCSERV